MKKLIAIGVFTLASMSLLSAKTYDIMVSSTTKAGSIELKPGQYKLSFNGGNATFTDVNSSKTYTTPVKVQEGDKKFDTTQMETTKQGETEVIQEIDLGGSKTKLGF